MNTTETKKLDLFTSYKNFINQNYEEVNIDCMYPILKWISANNYNPDTIYTINKYFTNNSRFKCIKNQQIFNMLKLCKLNSFITKYPKKPKDSNNLILDEYLKPYLKYGKNEINLIKQIFEKKMENPEFKQRIANFFGLDKKEQKLIGLEYKPINKKFNPTGTTQVKLF